MPYLNTGVSSLAPDAMRGMKAAWDAWATSAMSELDRVLSQIHAYGVSLTKAIQTQHTENEGVVREGFTRCVQNFSNVTASVSEARPVTRSYRNFWSASTAIRVKGFPDLRRATTSPSVRTLSMMASSPTASAFEKSASIKAAGPLSARMAFATERMLSRPGGSSRAARKEGEEGGEGSEGRKRKEVKEGRGWRKEGRPAIISFSSVRAL